MRCKSCRTVMEKTHEQVSFRSRQEWFRCPACDRVALTSTPRETGTTAPPVRDAWKAPPGHGVPQPVV